jgi:hypothetical protein
MSLTDMSKAFFIQHPFITFAVFVVLVLAAYFWFHLTVDQKTWDLRMFLLRSIVFLLIVMGVFIVLMVTYEGDKLLW